MSQDTRLSGCCMNWASSIATPARIDHRLQTNGKVERLCRTLNEDLIEYTAFDSIGHFCSELM